ncbi:two pore domain potassium channel family protein [Azohydromonas aeria]|uniref:two pore domain potassium channel family protein n=1 Tax=Azohydromonas aeria TaxID=2590212 RepID=UPI0012F96805|nr:two pore domain potassium channel family protein [Azohydromonas aeria]
MKRFLVRTRRHPSAILLIVQILGILLAPFIEESRYSHAIVNIFGIFVLILTTRMVRRTPGLTGVSLLIGAPAVVLLILQMTLDMPHLLPWSSALEAIFYFYAAGSLIAYMMADYRTTSDELFAAAATFTLFAWAFTHLFVLVQSLQPHAFSTDPGSVARTWSELNHLSFALLSSTGMGNVVAVSAHARAIASVEMMTGVLYLATVVARLIGFTIMPRK